MVGCRVGAYFALVATYALVCFTASAAGMMRGYDLVTKEKVIGVVYELGQLSDYYKGLQISNEDPRKIIREGKQILEDAGYWFKQVADDIEEVSRSMAQKFRDWGDDLTSYSKELKEKKDLNEPGKVFQKALMNAREFARPLDI